MDSQTSLPRAPLEKLHLWSTLFVIVACAVVYLPRMGSYGMYDPWETHYTEVARQFMVRGDWMSPYWHNGQGPEGFSETNFWSKPLGSMWLSGLSLKLFGYGAHTTGEEITMGNIEWVVRLPFVLCGFFGIFCIYLMCARIFGKRAGILSAVVLTTAPIYFMVSHQAMTDMPYVGLMSGGIALFVLAVFGEKEPLKRNGKWPTEPIFWGFLTTFLLVMTLQLTAITRELWKHPSGISLGPYAISLAPWMILYAILTVVAAWLSFRAKTKNEVYLYIFYMVVGYAGLSKGLIATLQPGLIILVYLLTAREWRLLADCAIGRGVLITTCVFLPWWHGMYARFGDSWLSTLVGTEQFRRLTVGEQEQAKGTHEYYVQQLGYALFPWIALLPAAIAKAFSFFKPHPTDTDGGSSPEHTLERARDRARLFIFIWFISSFGLFTLTITKYHYYFLPAVPPAAIAVGLYLDDLFSGRAKRVSLAIFIGILLLSIVGYDLLTQPAHWVWMFTYLYTPNWAQGVPEGTIIAIYGALAALCLFLVGISAARRFAIAAFVALSLGLGGYILNWYIVECAPHWSQKYVLKTYYKERKTADEKLVAWQFNWRGETWYTAADVIVAKSTENQAIQEWLKQRQGTRFFFITERSRYSSLRNMLPTTKGKETLRIVDDSNVHYVLAAASI